MKLLRNRPFKQSFWSKNSLNLREVPIYTHRPRRYGRPSLHAWGCVQIKRTNRGGRGALMVQPEVASPGDPAISATGLRKRYGKDESHIDALLGVDLRVERGEIVGILGPNGAGKTTLIEILEGLRGADAGSARVLGHDVSNAREMKAIRHRMGVSVQQTVLPPLLTVAELLSLHCALFPRSRPIDDLIEQVSLEEKRDTRIKHLSGGQQQRVAVALSLVSDPELIFLDEPTSQLDPQARRAVWTTLLQQRESRNAAMVINTHQMEEAQRLCDRVLVLDHGEILAEGAPDALIGRYCPERVVEFVAPMESDLDFLDGTTTALLEIEAGVRVRVQTHAVNTLITNLIERNTRGDLAVDDIRVDRQSLEDVFLKLTGRGIRD
ncbi:MAG: ABC transporter ATP-binding protein [Rhodanobacter sp.]